MSELAIVAIIIGLVAIAAIAMMVYLLVQSEQLQTENKYLRKENQRLGNKVDVLLDLLDTFWSREKELTSSVVREKSLDEVLRALHNLKSNGVTIQDSDVQIHRDLVGGDASTRNGG